MPARRPTLVRKSKNASPVEPLEMRTLFSAVHFLPAVQLPAGAGPAAIARGDFDGDGKADVVTANFAGSSLSVELSGRQQQSPAGAIFPPGPCVNTSLPFRPVAVVAGDFDGDGKGDVAVIAQSTAPNAAGQLVATNTVYVLHGLGDGHFGMPQALPGPRRLARPAQLACRRRLQWRRHHRPGRLRRRRRLDLPLRRLRPRPGAGRPLPGRQPRRRTPRHRRLQRRRLRGPRLRRRGRHPQLPLQPGRHAARPAAARRPRRQRRLPRRGRRRRRLQRRRPGRPGPGHLLQQRPSPAQRQCLRRRRRRNRRRRGRGVPGSGSSPPASTPTPDKSPPSPPATSTATARPISPSAAPPSWQSNSIPAAGSSPLP